MIHIANLEDSTRIKNYIKLVQYDFKPPLFDRINQQSGTNNIDKYIDKVFTNGKIIYADFNNEIIGVIFIYMNDYIEYKSYIPLLSVHKKYSGKGVAQKLLTFATNLAFENSMKTIIVKTWKSNLPAINLYLKNGFISTIKGEDIIFRKLKQ